MSENRSILIAGGAGYIGSHCSKAVSEAGFKPIVYDNLSTGHSDFVRWGPLVIGDIQNSDQITSTIRQYNISAVMHFAASSAVGESVANPQKYYIDNVSGTLALLRGMREAGCHKLIFSSTGAVYGNAGNEPINESSAGTPVNPYGQSKWMIERILADYHSSYSFSSICLRYFNACGADSSGTIGERRDPETHLIPRALMALQGHVSDFAIFGTDYATPDGTAVRDYIHVDDLAAAHVAALTRLLSENLFDVFNLGTGVGYSVKQIVDAVLTETGQKVPLTYHQRRPGDPPVLVANPSKCEHYLGFKATKSDLSRIVRSAWAWHQQAHSRYFEETSRKQDQG